MYPEGIKSWITAKKGYQWTISFQYKKNHYMKFYADIILYYGFIFFISLFSYIIMKNNTIKII